MRPFTILDIAPFWYNIFIHILICLCIKGKVLLFKWRLNNAAWSGEYNCYSKESFNFFSRKQVSKTSSPDLTKRQKYTVRTAHFFYEKSTEKVTRFICRHNLVQQSNISISVTVVIGRVAWSERNTQRFLALAWIFDFRPVPSSYGFETFSSLMLVMNLIFDSSYLYNTQSAAIFKKEKKQNFRSPRYQNQ